MKWWPGGVPGLVGGILVAVGAVLPWLSVYGGLYQYPAAAGVHGKLLFATGLLAASLGAVLAVRPGRLPFWGAGLVGFVCLALAGYLTAQLVLAWHGLKANPFLLAAPGPGPVVSLLGAALAFGTLFVRPPAAGRVWSIRPPAPGPKETRPPAQSPSKAGT